MKAALSLRIAGACGLALAAMTAAAQSRPPTTEQLGRDPGALRQEAEQQQAQQQRAQQQQSQQQADQQWNDTVRQQQSRANADMANAAATRRSLEQRPALAPEKNPLLGRWDSLGSGKPAANAAGLPPELAKMAAELVGGVMAGVCDSMLGHGTIEFRPGGVFAIGRDGRERLMYRAEYRGGGSEVVVLPMGGTAFSYMFMDFHGRDRAVARQVGCTLARAGGGGADAAVANASLDATDGAATPHWALIGTVPNNGGVDLYVARESIRRSGDRARMLNLFDFRTRQVFEGKPFLSSRNQYEFDCARSRQRVLSATGYSGHMGQGSVVISSSGDSPWQPVGTSGPMHDHWSVACGRS